MILSELTDGSTCAWDEDVPRELGEQDANQNASEAVETPTPATARAGDVNVKSLLNFVNVVSGDIRAALDKSAPLKRCVDHRKYLQRQLRRFSGARQASSHEAASQSCSNSCSHSQSCSNSSLHSQERQCSDETRTAKGSIFEEFSTKAHYERCSPAGEKCELQQCASAGSSSLETPQRSGHLSVFRQSGVPGPEDFPNSGAHLSKKRSGLYLRQRQSDTVEAMADSTVSVAFTGRAKSPESKNTRDNASTPNEKTLTASELSDPLFDRIHEHEEKDKQATPLRQRQLPASFWQEPSVPKSVSFSGENFSLYGKYGSHVATPAFYKDLLQGGYGSAQYAYGTEPLQSRGLPLQDHFYHSLAAKYGTEAGVSAAATLYPWNYGVSPVVSDSKKVSPTPGQTLGAYNPASAAYLLEYHRTQSHGASAPSGAMVTARAGWSPPGGSQRTTIWRPIPTKSVTSYQARYHPFANVH